MRDINRIDNFCNALSSAWKCVPDWRFGQLMSNMFGAYYGETGRDIFYTEDDEMMEYFVKFVCENTPYTIIDDSPQEGHSDCN